ncbi:unnamed protein product [Periconia digitata]|uniref:Uncharacterized protein n=1 Tax=Periconia digitata TaxID=1303443 RepID=A0A9W4UWS1_9PLEO|nr:unnamed protein product [Periconia digitata]
MRRGIIRTLGVLLQTPQPSHLRALSDKSSCSARFCLQDVLFQNVHISIRAHFSRCTGFVLGIIVGGVREVQ